MSIDPAIKAQIRAGLAQQKKAADYAKDPGKWANEKLGVHLWSKQRDICDSVRDNKRTVVASCHGSGKALTLDTPLRKPDDTWTTMGEVQVGDWLLDEQYRPTQVVAVTPVEERKTLEVYLTHTVRRSEVTGMGEAACLVASHEHEWAVLSPQEQARITVLCQRHGVSKPDWSYWMHRTASRRCLARRAKSR
jgi:replicative DNA helicase